MEKYPSQNPDNWEQIYPRDTEYKRAIRLQRLRQRRWWVRYRLTYGAKVLDQEGYYRTYIGARIAMFCIIHSAAPGGFASIHDHNPPRPGDQYA